jgi:LPS O-antigen subunit length determinant protein (WzzB/FepE family)
MLENRLDLAVEQNMAFKACLELKFQMRKLRRLQSFSNTAVGRIIGELKTKVNKKRDEMKQKIDSDADKLVNELGQLETECNTKSQNPLRFESITKALKTSDDSLIKWENEELLAEKVDA